MCKPAIAVQGAMVCGLNALLAFQWLPFPGSYQPFQAFLLRLHATQFQLLPSMAVHFPKPILCSLFLEFFPGFMLSLLPLFYLYISPSFFHMFLFSETTSAYKNGPLWNAISVDQESLVAMKKDNIMRYISKSIIKIFGKRILFYAKCFRLTFKYVKVSAKRFNFQCLVSDHKLSKNVESESTGPRKSLVVRVKEDGKG